MTDYVDNPLLMDYYGFPQALYELKFKSRGDSKLAQRVVDLYKQVINAICCTMPASILMYFSQAGIRARTTTVDEPRGEDGRGFQGPGLDHGVFIPFRIMFGEEFIDIPIVQVSIDSSLDPIKNWEIGQAVVQLRQVGPIKLLVPKELTNCYYCREEGILVLSGGLTAHNLRDRTSFSPDTAKPAVKEFDKAIHQAIQIENVSAMAGCMMHNSF